MKGGGDGTIDLAGIDGITEVLARSEAIARLASRVTSTAQVTARVPEAMMPGVAAAIRHLRSTDPRPGLSIVVEDDDIARDLADTISPYLPDVEVAYLPHRGVDWGAPMRPPAHLVGERATALEVLSLGGVVVVSAAALVERIPARQRRLAAVGFRTGDEVDREDIIRRLVEVGYVRVDGRVEERATLSARGDVVDVFPTTGREPLRIELFGDEIERLSAFSPLTQRSLRELAAITIQPAVESNDDRADPFAEEAGVPIGLVPLVPELLAAGALVVWQPRRVAAACAERLGEIALGRSERRRGYLAAPDVDDLIANSHALDDLPTGQAIVIEGQRPALSARGTSEAENELRSMVRQGMRVVVAFGHAGDAVRAARLASRASAELLDAGQAIPSKPGVSFVDAAIRRGFVAPSLGIALLPAQLLFRRRAASSRGVAARLALDFSDLRIGDYVVHEDHGIGRFAGFDTRTVGGVTRDYIDLDYRGEDRLFLPHDQISKLSRYLGSDARPPQLSKLGGKSWDTIRARARNAVRELAGELLALYAARASRSKEPLDGAGEVLEQIEARFAYSETDDQQRAIEAVREDLESEQPMDRLVCGDVGFGKTEVAVRARGDRRRVGASGPDARADHDPLLSSTSRRSEIASAISR